MAAGAPATAATHSPITNPLTACLHTPPCCDSALHPRAIMCTSPPLPMFCCLLRSGNAQVLDAGCEVSWMLEMSSVNETLPLPSPPQRLTLRSGNKQHTQKQIAEKWLRIRLLYPSILSQHNRLRLTLN
ncbi:hypothetical protein KC19_2G193900, partial [Ceratodon purpureus]